MRARLEARRLGDRRLHPFAREHVAQPRRRAAALGRDDDARPAVAQRADPARERLDVADDRIERRRRELRRVGRVRRRRAGSSRRPSCARAAARTAARGAGSRGPRPPRCPRASRPGSPPRRAAPGPGRASGGARRAAPARPAGRRSGRRCSSSVSHGSHDSMPSKIWPSASRSHCARPHGAVAISARGPLAHLGRREQLAAREDQHLVELVRCCAGRRPRTPRAGRSRRPRGRRAPGGRRSTGTRRRSSRAPRSRRAPRPGTRAGSPRRRAARAGRRDRSASPLRRTIGSTSSTCGPSRCTSARTGATTTAGAPSPPSRSRHMIRSRRPIVSSAGDTRSIRR